MRKTNLRGNPTNLYFFLFLLFGNTLLAQTEFFNSKLGFSQNQLSNFYSSFLSDSEQIYFTGNDYKLHVYNKKNGAEVWSYNLNLKSNTPVKLYENKIFANTYFNEINQCAVLDRSNGKFEQILSIASVSTKPFFKGDIMYCTGLDDGGQMIAYDLKQNKILWKKFIAHGVDTNPYYLNDKIIVNAEADNWIVLNYDGKMIENNCKNKVSIFIDSVDICVKKFKYLNHKQKEIAQEFIDKELDHSEVEMSYL